MALGVDVGEQQYVGQAQVVGGVLETGADQRGVELGPYVGGNVDVVHDKLLGPVGHALDRSVSGVPGRAVVEAQADTGGVERFDRPLHLMPRNPHRNLIAHGVAVFKQHEEAGEPIANEHLPTDSQAGADEPGRRHQDERGDAEHLRPGDHGDGGDDQGGRAARVTPSLAPSIPSGERGRRPRVVS